MAEALGEPAPEPEVDGGLSDRVVVGVRRWRRTGVAVVAAIAVVMVAVPIAVRALRPASKPVPVAGGAANKVAAERDVAARLVASPLRPGRDAYPASRLTPPE